VAIRPGAHGSAVHGTNGIHSTQSTQSTQSTNGTPPVPLLTPRDGIPAVVADDAALTAAVAAMATGSGPVAVDAERASGYRYGQRAYLVQLRRTGAGTVVIDPIGCADLARMGAVIADEEWVLHAAGQDLPCLAEVGLRPRRLFDTELAGRLLGYPRVGLGVMVETILGLTLEKGHSAVDWSTRPLPEPWLRYAALDVEVLIELRDELESELCDAGKLDWARQEFAAIAAAPPPAGRPEPWRRTSGLHRVRGRRQLAVVRSLWETRDSIARDRDVTPGRVLADAAIIDAALAMPRSVRDLATLALYARVSRSGLDRWCAAVDGARGLPESALPQLAAPSDGPPPARLWNEREPAAAERLMALRTAIAAIADEHNLPTENLLAPDTVRRIAWSPPDDVSTETLEEVLRRHGARDWQVSLTAAAISGALDRLRTRDLGV
jgi:ribonuclease D